MVRAGLGRAAVAAVHSAPRPLDRLVRGPAARPAARSEPASGPDPPRHARGAAVDDGDLAADRAEREQRARRRGGRRDRGPARAVPARAAVPPHRPLQLPRLRAPAPPVHRTLPLADRGNPVFAYSNWHRLRSPYGPLFTLLLLPTAKVPLPVAYWSYKALVTAASLGMLGAIWGAARRLGRDPVPAVAFVGLNPVVLVYALGGKHNDLLMMAALMGGALLLLERRELLGGAALAGAVAIKASAGLLAPLVALRRAAAPAGLRRPGRGGRRARARRASLAFGAHLPDVRDQDQLVGVYSVPNLLGYAAGHGGADAAVRRAASVLLIGGALACAFAAWRTRSLAPAGWAALLAVLTAAWLMPWYVLWALPFAALARSRTLRAATVLVAVWVALVWTGVVPQLYHGAGIYLSRTRVGRENHAVMDRFLLDHGRCHRAHTHVHRHARAAPAQGRSGGGRPACSQRRRSRAPPRPAALRRSGSSARPTAPSRRRSPRAAARYTLTVDRSGKRVLQTPLGSARGAAAATTSELHERFSTPAGKRRRHVLDAHRLTLGFRGGREDRAAGDRRRRRAAPDRRRHRPDGVACAARRARLAAGLPRRLRGPLQRDAAALGARRRLRLPGAASTPAAAPTRC